MHTHTLWNILREKEKEEIFFNNIYFHSIDPKKCADIMWTKLNFNREEKTNEMKVKTFECVVLTHSRSDERTDWLIKWLNDSVTAKLTNSLRDLVEKSNCDRCVVICICLCCLIFFYHNTYSYNESRCRC